MMASLTTRASGRRIGCAAAARITLSYSSIDSVKTTLRRSRTTESAPTAASCTRASAPRHSRSPMMPEAAIPTTPPARPMLMRSLPTKQLLVSILLLPQATTPRRPTRSRPCGCSRRRLGWTSWARQHKEQLPTVPMSTRGGSLLEPSGSFRATYMRETAVTKIAIGLLAGMLIGCAAPGPTPEETLRAASFDLVASYARAGQAFLATGKAEQQLIEAAQEAAKAPLKDPNSAQFRNVRVVSHDFGKLVCGQINAKNSYGGYVGFRTFAASPVLATITRESGRYASVDAAANAGIVRACGP